MTALTSCLYLGEVVHRRLAPLRHELRYKVYNLFVDVDALPNLGLKLLSYNRFNLFGVKDRDFGDVASAEGEDLVADGDGVPAPGVGGAKEEEP